ncbi:hypothetical protein CMK11_22475 [Candidatus Poribacteria bacterium]|nr:hypothetical protein [Candidatus Poribacteria bacterium]
MGFFEFAIAVTGILLGSIAAVRILITTHMQKARGLTEEHRDENWARYATNQRAGSGHAAPAGDACGHDADAQRLGGIPAAAE